MTPTLTPDLIRAASTDAGNRSMRENGRTKWNRDDLAACHSEWHRLSRIAKVGMYGNEPMLPKREAAQ
jgi:hypothetical protein